MTSFNGLKSIVSCKVCGLEVENRIHGLLCDIHYREYRRRYAKTPKQREYQREYAKTPKRREYRREYVKTPKQREYRREYAKTPKQREYYREYAKTPKQREYRRERALRNKIMWAQQTPKEQFDNMWAFVQKKLREGKKEAGDSSQD
jgi:hypothetical protein